MHVAAAVTAAAGGVDIVLTVVVAGSPAAYAQ